MLPVSPEYIEKIKAPVRKIRAKVEITWTDAFIDATVQVSANEQNNVYWPKHVADGKDSPRFKYFSLDGSSTLDGTYHMAPGTELGSNYFQFGWWSKKLAGAGGAFSAPYPTLTVTFFARPLVGLKVVGDDKRAEWPVDFDINIYNASGLIHTELVTDNTEVTWIRSIAELNIMDATKLELVIKKWSHTGRTAKILEFFTAVQEIYTDDDIMSISLLEEREISKGSLPIGNVSSNEIDIKLANLNNRFSPGNTASAISNLVKPNRKIRAWIGVELGENVVEYQPLGVFWSGDWNVPEDQLYASTSGRDRLELLRKTTFSTSQVYINATLYDIAINIFEDGGLYTDDYWVDTELQQFTVPYAWFDPMSHRDALRKVVEACMGQMYVDRKNIIRIEGPSYIQLP